MNINEAIAEVDAGTKTTSRPFTSLFREARDELYWPLLDSPGCTLEAARVAYNTLSELQQVAYDALSTDYGRPRTTTLRSLQGECRRLVAASAPELHQLRGISQLVNEVIDALDERADDGGSW